LIQARFLTKISSGVACHYAMTLRRSNEPFTVNDGALSDSQTVAIGDKHFYFNEAIFL